MKRFHAFIFACLLALSLNHAYAKDCDDCSKAPAENEGFPEKLLKATSSSGLSCFDALQLTDAKKEADGINKNQPIISKHYLNAGKLKRFKLAGTSKEHEFLRKLVGGKTVDSSELKKMKDCKTVQCAIAGIYGNKESGLRAFNIYYNDGYLLSVGSAEYPWKLEEVRNISRTFEILPKSFRHMPTLSIIRKPPLGTLEKNDYNGMTRRNKEDVTIQEGLLNDQFFSTLVHELAHHYDFSNKDSFQKISWKQTKFWSLFSKDHWKKKPEQDVLSFAREYGMTNPYEDFATSVEAYVTDPNALQMSLYTDFGVKYDYLKKEVFSGIEYLNTSMFNIYTNTITQKFLYTDGKLKEALLTCREKQLRPSANEQCFEKIAAAWVQVHLKGNSACNQQDASSLTNNLVFGLFDAHTSILESVYSGVDELGYPILGRRAEEDWSKRSDKTRLKSLSFNPYWKAISNNETERFFLALKLFDQLGN